MRKSFTAGVGFGLTSGVITTLGLLVGLYAGTRSFTAVISGVVVVAIADALSDAMGMHISVESEAENTERSVWETTFATFGAKFVTAMSFLIPLVIFPLALAVVVSLGWGLLLVACFSYMVAKERGESSLEVIFQHLLLAVLVIIVTHLVGGWVGGLI